MTSCNNQNFLEESKNNFRKLDLINYIKSRKDDKKSELEIWTMIKLAKSWGLNGKMKDEFERKVIKRLKFFDVIILRRYDLKIKVGQFMKKELKQLIKRCIWNSARTNNEKEWIADRINIIEQKGQNIKKIVYKFNKKNVRKCNRECNCQNYEESWKVNNHVRKKIEDIQMFENTILCENNKTPIEEGKDREKNRKIELIKSLKKWKIELKYEDLSTIPNRRLKYSFRDIAKIMKNLVGLILVERDKNNFTWEIECNETFRKREEMITVE
jgi:hypothetical protein